MIVGQYFGSLYQDTGESPQRLQQLVEHAPGGVQQHHQRGRNHRPGQKAGQQHGRLEDAVGHARLDLVQQQREQHAHEHVEQRDAHDVVHQRVDDDAPAVDRFEKLPEKLQPHEGAARNAPGRLVVDKGQINARHGQIAEQKHPERRNQKHGVISRLRFPAAPAPEAAPRVHHMLFNSRFHRVNQITASL